MLQYLYTYILIRNPEPGFCGTRVDITPPERHHTVGAVFWQPSHRLTSHTVRGRWQPYCRPLDDPRQTPPERSEHGGWTATTASISGPPATDSAVHLPHSHLYNPYRRAPLIEQSRYTSAARFPSPPTTPAESFPERIPLF